MKGVFRVIHGYERTDFLICVKRNDYVLQLVSCDGNVWCTGLQMGVITAGLLSLIHSLVLDCDSHLIFRVSKIIELCFVSETALKATEET